MTYEQAIGFAFDGATTLDEMSAATCAAMLAAYYQVYGEVDATIKDLQPETSFRYRLPGSNLWDVVGVIDGLGVTHDGRRVLVEYKTTSSSLDADSDYWLRLKYNMQILMYVDASIRLHQRPDYIIYDVSRKPSISPKDIPQLDDNGKKIVLDSHGQRVFKADGSPRESSDKAAGHTLSTRPETPEEFSTRLYQDILTRPEFYFARKEVAVLMDDLESFIIQRSVLANAINYCVHTSRKCRKPEHAWAKNVNEHNCKFCEFSAYCLQGIELIPGVLPDQFTTEKEERTNHGQPTNDNTTTQNNPTTANPC